VPSGAVYFGEVALSGEIRPVSLAPLRLREARKLGFEEAGVPANLSTEEDGLRLSRYTTLAQYVDRVLGRG
jgi:DNA repair protein RadA/Sms